MCVLIAIITMATITIDFLVITIIIIINDDDLTAELKVYNKILDVLCIHIVSVTMVTITIATIAIIL